MKVLLTGNLFNNYESSIKKALEQNGCEVDLLFNNIEGPYYWNFQTTNWLKYGFLPHKAKFKWFLNRNILAYNNKLKKIILAQNYDLLFVVKGLTISSEILDIFKGIKILWMLDSIKRFPRVLNSISFYNYVFTYEPDDVIFCKNNSLKDIEFLPVGFDESQYYRMNLKKRNELSFVGGVTQNREALLKQIINHDIEIKIIGGFHKSKDYGIRSKCISKYADHAEINKLYNESIINLNIHKDQSKEGTNPRTFEIMGAGGGLLISNSKSILRSYFVENQEIVYYSSPEELIRKVKYYKCNQNEANDIAAAAYLKVRANHTWADRIKEMLTYIDESL